MRVLHVVEPGTTREDLVQAAKSVSSLGHEVLVTDDLDSFPQTMEVIRDQGYVVVTDKPALINPIRREIQRLGIPVGDFKALVAGKLSPQA